MINKHSLHELYLCRIWRFANERCNHEIGTELVQHIYGDSKRNKMHKTIKIQVK